MDKGCQMNAAIGEREKVIGVVAGAGPYAGLDLVKKILDQTRAVQDQDHLTIISLSRPSLIPDRTAFLQKRSPDNPADEIAAQLIALHQAGAHVAAIPCNTAHAPSIYQSTVQLLKDASCDINFLHMIDETAVHLARHHADIKTVGVLSTTGTYEVGIYPQALAKSGLRVVVPSRQTQAECVNRAIYDPEVGVKAAGGGTDSNQKWLGEAIDELAGMGAEAIILGCTELPLALTTPTVRGLAMIDPTVILARALIREAAPSKLKIWRGE